MRILSVHNHYKISAGEDTVFYAEASLLKKHGHVVELLTLSNNDLTSLTDKLKAALGVVYNFKSAKLIEEKINVFKPDVLHVHNFFPLISPAVFYVAHKLKVPVVMTLHNYRLICPSAYLHYNGKVHLENIHQIFPLKAILDKAYRKSYTETASVVLATGVHKLAGTWRRKVDRFITLTQNGADLFLNSSLKLRPEQIVVKPNFATDLGLGSTNREQFFLYVGRLSPEKGIETLLKAAALHEFHLKIIGDGSESALVEAYAANHPNIEFLGYQQKERVISELKSAKALLFTSEWLETFGMTIVEAFSTGTPVIASKIGGAEFLVQHGINGLHYTPGKVDELIEQVILLQNDPDLATNLGLEARKSYLQDYTPEENYRRLIAIYADVVKNTKKPVLIPVREPKTAILE
jgi:glycosyltransferase involved in cell wall biosynthesis